MKTILCYGDSNTWGYNPASGERFERNVRWPGLMQQALGDRVHVVEEGLCGRTSTWEDFTWDGRNGRTFLPVALESHSPLDLVIIMLGTNELKSAFNLSAKDIAVGITKLAETVLQAECGAPELLLVSPAHCSEHVYTATDTFDGAVEKSREMAPHLERMAKELEVHFFDAASVAEVDPADGLHLNEAAHSKLAEALAARAIAILGD